MVHHACTRDATFYAEGMGAFKADKFGQGNVGWESVRIRALIGRWVRVRGLRVPVCYTRLLLPVSEG